MKSFKVFLDMDGVIADFVTGAIELHGKSFRKEEYLKTKGKAAWGIQGWYSGPEADFWGKMGFDFWANLPRTDEADSIVRLCIDAIGLEHICVLTSPVKTPGCIEGKRAWLDRHYPYLPMLASCHSADRECSSPPPKSFCANEHSILIDDYDKNICEWIKHGGIGLLYPRRWNTLADYEQHGLQQLEQLFAAALVLDCFRIERLSCADD